MKNTYTTISTYSTTANVDDLGNEFITTEAYVDRIEEVEKGVNRAVLYFGEDDEKVVMPVSMLPDGIKPDDTLIIKVAISED